MKPSSEWIGKNVFVIFDDGGKIQRKDGILTRFDNMGVGLDDKEFYYHNRVIRVRLKEDGEK